MLVSTFNQHGDDTAGDNGKSSHPKVPILARYRFAIIPTLVLFDASLDVLIWSKPG
jgi:hypothetical protein